MNSRIRRPLYVFPLNPDYVAARSLRSLRSNKSLYSPRKMREVYEICKLNYCAFCFAVFGHKSFEGNVYV